MVREQDKIRFSCRPGRAKLLAIAAAFMFILPLPAIEAPSGAETLPTNYTAGEALRKLFPPDTVDRPPLQISALSCDLTVSGGPIQDALDKARPGNTVCVKNGIYKGKVDISKDSITLKNYPGHNPVIIPGYSSGSRVEINASRVTVEGFEIRGGSEGIKIYKPYTIIRKNYIHDNKMAGIMIVSTNNSIIVGNEIEMNGTCRKRCDKAGEQPVSPKHVHGIYISDFLCRGAKNNVIRKNAIKNHPGMGISLNASSCKTTIEGTIIEENELINNAWGLGMFYNVKHSRINNNRFSASSHPATNHTEFAHIGLWGSPANSIHKNVFISTLPGYEPLKVYDKASEHQEVDYNSWITSSEDWVWGGSSETSFSTEYKSVTGWDDHGTIKLSK